MVYNLEVPLGLLAPATPAWLSLAWLSLVWLSPQAWLEVGSSSSPPSPPPWAVGVP